MFLTLEIFQRSRDAIARQIDLMSVSGPGEPREGK
jgi:hypothetical protein